jgi:hypothetical protein
MGASSAAAAGQFGESGSEAGQFAVPNGVAVDQASGDVYVVDRNNQRVEKFTPTGGFLVGWGWGVADGTTEVLQTCTTTCFAGIKGSGAGQFNFPQGVAVDNSTSPLDMSVGDVYVVDVRNNRVEKFSPSGAFLLMFGGEVNEATKGNVCLAGEKCQAGIEGTENGQFELHSMEGIYIAVGSTGTVYVGDENRVQEFSPDGVYESQLTLAGAGHTRYLAVDSFEDLYVKSDELSGIQEYDSSGALINTLDSEGGPQSPAIDSFGDLLIADNGLFNHILKYDSSGNLVTSFDSGGPQGMAFGDTAGTLYIVSGNTVRLVTLPSPGPLVEPGSESATEVQRTTATLNATVNPEGHEASSSEEISYHFEYGETESYGSSTPSQTSIGGSFEDRSLSTGVTALQPRTTYHFRVVATNSAHETTSGPDETFTTLPPLLIDSESASNVTSSSVTLGAQINPLGSETEYRFEYDISAYESSARHGTSVPVPTDIVAGTGDVAVSEHVQNLLPGTAYHYRVVAINGLGLVEGADRAFTTQPVGESPTLPDGRQWELVSPPDKHGATIQSFDGDGAAIQASEGGGAFTYAVSSPTQANPPGNVGPERVQVLSTRTASSGWLSRDIATPHNEPTVEAQVGHASEYALFSSDLSFGMVEPVGETPLSSEASEQTPYRRDNASDSYQPLITAANASGAKFANQIELVSATPDLSHIVITSGVSLTTPLSGAGLYEWGGGVVQPVGVLPDDEPAPDLALLGNKGFSKDGIVRHAISNDGSRVVWESQAEGHLYMRDMSREETVQLDVVESGARGGVGVPVFQTASSDGSKVFFTDSKRLTVGSKSGGDLYEFEVTSPGVAGRLRDLNVGGVSGVVLGASEDGSYIYLVNGSVLNEAENDEKEKAVPGGNNLYVLHDNGVEWSTTFVTRLSNNDENDWRESLIGLTSRVSPDGRWLAFMSDRPLTRYDNHDAGSEQLDEEVFLYEAGSRHLVCASCNSSGARPAGMFDTGHVPLPLVDVPHVWDGRWLAGLIPGWTPNRLSHALYQSRYLSNGGRLFFDSSDALVSRDINGTQDVYEYEPKGVGGCGHEGGCVALISSGSSGEESAFLDASESGDDVFFLTAARLVSQDRDASLDVYDAHVCSTAVPCLAHGAVLPPACTNSDSCRVAPSPQPPIFGPSPSATFSGAGNIIPQSSRGEPKRVKCKRGLVRRKVKGKARCVKLKRKAHGAKHAKNSTRGRKG